MTFIECLGSINYVMWSSDAHDSFARPLGEDEILDLTMLFGCGCVSGEDIRYYLSSRFGHLMLFDSDTDVSGEVITLALDSPRSATNHLVEAGGYAVTLRHELFEGIDVWFHVVLDTELENSIRQEFSKRSSIEEEQLARDVV